MPPLNQIAQLPVALASVAVFAWFVLQLIDRLKPTSKATPSISDLSGKLDRILETLAAVSKSQVLLVQNQDRRDAQEDIAHATIGADARAARDLLERIIKVQEDSVKILSMLSSFARAHDPLLRDIDKQAQEINRQLTVLNAIAAGKPK